MRQAAIAALALLFASFVAHAEHIADYEVDIAAHSDGSLFVHESIRYDFGDAWRHGIYRDVPLIAHRGGLLGERRISLHLVDVRIDGRPVRWKTMHVASRDGEPFVRWRIGDPNQRITGVHRYELWYRVEGALFAVDHGHDAFIWNAIGTGWNVPILHVRVEFLPPSSLQNNLALALRAFIGRRGSRRELEPVFGERSVWEAERLAPHEGITVQARFPRGAIAATAPRSALSEVFANYKVELVFWLVCMGIVAGWWAYWRRYGRDPKIGHIAVRYKPPENIGAAEAGILLDESVRDVHAAAAILELARDGYVEIREPAKKGWFGSSAPVLVRGRPPTDWDALPRYKRFLLLALFPGMSRVFNPAMTRDALRSERREWWERFRSELAGWSVKKGWYVRNPATARLVALLVAAILFVVLFMVGMQLSTDWPAGSVLQVVAWAMLVAGVWVTVSLWRAMRSSPAWQRWVVAPLALAFIAVVGWKAAEAMDADGWMAMLDPRALLVPLFPAILAGATGFVFAWHMPQRTPKGARMLRDLFGLRRFMERAERPRLARLLAEDPNYFMRTLPFALIFGLAEEWTERFAGMVSLPTWYAGGNFHDLAHTANALGSQVAGAIAPPASSGGTSGGGVGGGGGGGGGGSW